jgi:hypothetical protein
MSAHIARSRTQNKSLASFGTNRFQDKNSARFGVRSETGCFVYVVISALLSVRWWSSTTSSPRYLPSQILSMEG